MGHKNSSSAAHPNMRGQLMPQFRHDNWKSTDPLCFIGRGRVKSIIEEDQGCRMVQTSLNILKTKKSNLEINSVIDWGASVERSGLKLNVHAHKNPLKTERQHFSLVVVERRGRGGCWESSTPVQTEGNKSWNGEFKLSKRWSWLDPG